MNGWPTKCRTCGRKLKDWRKCAKDDPAMDCGGDCKACVDRFEKSWVVLDDKDGDA